MVRRLGALLFIRRVQYYAMLRTQKVKVAAKEGEYQRHL